MAHDLTKPLRGPKTGDYVFYLCGCGCGRERGVSGKARAAEPKRELWYLPGHEPKTKR